MLKFILFLLVNWPLPLSLMADTVEVDHYVYIGDELQLTCNLKKKHLEKHCNASFLTFEKEKFEMYKPDIFTPVSRENVSIKSNSRAVLTLSNITENDAGSYSCFVNSCIKEREEIKTYSVSAQYKPQNVTNFDCVIVNWDEYLFCGWEHPVHYVEKLNDTITSMIFYDGKNYVEYPELKVNKYTWNELSGSRYYYFYFNVTNKKKNHSAVSMFTISPIEKVKPSPVINITFEELKEKNCFNVSWSYLDLLSIKQFQLHYQGPDDQEMKIIADLTKRYEIVCNMKPDTSYNFSVICEANYSFLESDPKIISYKTPEKAPRLGPESVNGSYTSGKCIKNERNITVFWKKIEKNAANGKITNYIIRYRTGESIVGFDKHQATIQLPCDSLESIEILAKNSAGQSKKPTVLLIAPYHFKVPTNVESSFAVKLDAGSYTAHWDANNHTYVDLHYTVFWLKDVENETSKQEINWKIIPKTEQAIKISYDPKLKFGCSVTNESSGLTSSIMWTECIYKSELNEEPDFVVDKYTDVSVIVRWNRMECSKKYPYRVTTIILLYCKENPCDKIKDIEIPPTMSQYTVSGLQTAIVYKFAMYVKVGDMKGPTSKWQRMVILGSSSDFMINIIVTCVLLAAVVAFISCVYIWKKCKVAYNRKKMLMSDENSESPNTDYLLPGRIMESEIVCQKFSFDNPSINHPKSIQTALGNPFMLSHKCDSKILNSECLLSSSSFTDCPPPSELNSLLIEPAHSLSDDTQVDSLLSYCVIRNMRPESDELSVKLISELGLETTEIGDGNFSDMIDNVIISQHSVCRENKAEGNTNSDRVSTTELLLPLDKGEDDNKLLLNIVSNFHESENLKHCKDYVTLNEKNSLRNQTIMIGETSQKNTYTKNIFQKPSVLDNLVKENFTEIPFNTINGSNHSLNLTHCKEYVTLNKKD